jgi:hypothetical protein
MHHHALVTLSTFDQASHRPSAETDGQRPSQAARRELLCRAGAGLAALLGGGALLSLGGCANMPAGLSNLELSHDMLLAALAGQFPVERRLLQFFDVSLALPKLQLLPQDNRLKTEFEISVGETLLTKKVFKGALGFASGVRYEAGDHTIRMARVQVDKLSIPGVPEMIGGRLQAIASLLAETLIENMSVYKMPENIARLADTLGYAPGVLKVTSTGLAVPFEPIRKG